LLLACSCVATAAGATDPAVLKSSEPSGTPTVSAFYYPWFETGAIDGSYTHWAQDGSSLSNEIVDAPPTEIASAYFPALGVYSSADPAVLGDQMDEIHRAGINEIAVSWWGRGSIEDQRLPAIVAAARVHRISVAVHIEDYSGRSVASVSSDVAYLETLGITTFYVYQPFTLTPASWAPLNDALRAEGLTIYGQTALVGQAVAGHFSGIYTYDIATWSAGKFGRLCTEAHAHGLLCAPSVGPGYDARRATGDSYVKPRRGGLTYDSMWGAAILAGADSVTITSFNEWQEGTQIEPAAPAGLHAGFSSYVSYDGAWGLEGSAAEDAYLDRTAYWAALFRQARGPQPYPRPT
jgi:hypothetical protein